MKLDASKTALLILHCQNELLYPEGKYSYTGVYKQVEKHGLLNKLQKIIAAAHAANVCVIYVNNVFEKGYPELGARTLPILAGCRDVGGMMNDWGGAVADPIKPTEEDLVIINKNTSAFSYTNLDQVLRAKEIKQLILTGVATNFVVDSTARYGSELGYDIIVPQDGCVSFTDEMHDFEMKYNLPQFCQEITTVDEICKQLKD